MAASSVSDNDDEGEVALSDVEAIVDLRDEATLDLGRDGGSATIASGVKTRQTKPVVLDPDLRAPSSLASPQGRTARWLASLDKGPWRATRRLLVVIGLLPLLILVATRVNLLVDSVILATYGVLVILGTCFLMYRAFVSYRDPAFEAPAIPVDEQPLVSIIIPAKDEEAIIESCVRSVLASSHENLEVIVVDDGSTDNTLSVVRTIEDDRLRVVALDENIGKKRACTEAARHATGSIIAFTDSDCVVAVDAIELCVRALAAHPELGAVAGHGRALNASKNLLTRMQDVWYDSQFAVTKAAEASYGTVSCVSGPMAVYRREAVISYMPAWAADRFAGGEFLFATDRQLTASVLGQDRVGDRLQSEHSDDPLVSEEDNEPQRWDIGYVRSARVWTEVPDTPKRFFRQQVRWKKSFIRNVFFNGPWLWRRGVGASLLYYGHVLWVIAAPIMAFRHLIWFPAQGEWTLTWLYLAGIFFKGFVWAGAYRVHNPTCNRWIYRPLMSVLSTVGLSWLIVYSTMTLRRSVWARG